MSEANWKKQSRCEVGSTDGRMTEGTVSSGALQRIADATEKMADGFNVVLKERDYHKNESEKFCRWFQEEAAKVRDMQAQISNLRGQITKLKKRLEAKANG